jgi:hypothetical protein
LPQDKINEILTKNNLPLDSFIIGFVFRNQLRKLINTQIEAYAQFKRVNPELKNTFLYTHTHYGEGWDIHRLCEQYGVNKRGNKTVHRYQRTQPSLQRLTLSWFPL